MTSKPAANEELSVCAHIAVSVRACTHGCVCVCIWGGAILLVAELPRGYGGKKPHKEIKTKLQFLHIRADTEIWVQ